MARCTSVVICHDVEMHRSLAADPSQRPCRYRSPRFHRRWLSLRLYDPRIRQVLRRQNERGIPASAPPIGERAGGRVKLRRKRKFGGVAATPRSAQWQRAERPLLAVDRATGWTPDTIHPRSHGEVAMGRSLQGDPRSCDRRALDKPAAQHLEQPNQEPAARIVRDGCRSLRARWCFQMRLEIAKQLTPQTA